METKNLPILKIHELKKTQFDRELAAGRLDADALYLVPDDNTDLDNALADKANASDLAAHTANKSNPHGVTKAQVGLGNVENKSSATIRGELTKENVTTALGYTPPTTDTTYSTGTASTASTIS